MTRLTEWLKQAEAWLDERGRAAWFIAMILGFVLAWPLGLALLAYMIWSGRMCRWKSCRTPARRAIGRPTGNAAFDEYREETLRRLEEEQTAFESFLERLRKARDKAEFDQFMAERTAPEPQQA